MAYLSAMDPATGFLSADDVKDLGRELSGAYNSATPFPHVVIDDFLPAAILERCLAEFPAQTGTDDVSYDRAQERYKTQYNPDSLSDWVRALFYAFNSRPFVRVLENITGIKGLIPDPFFLGGGFHEIKEGGHLSVHADFNHHKPMGLERRINVLIYLNKDWTDGYGGQLELWDKGMSKCERSIVPVFDRCVIFNTTGHSNHGNPRPISYPDGLSRKSIALYYYTATWDGSARSHTTQFRVRPTSEDKTDWFVRGRELFEDVMPPAALRMGKRVKQFLKAR